MSDTQSCGCTPARASAGRPTAPRGASTKKWLPLAAGGGLLCAVACAAGPLVVGAGLTATAAATAAFATGIGVTAAVGATGIAVLVAYLIVKRRRTGTRENAVTEPIQVAPKPVAITPPAIACTPAAIDEERRAEHQKLLDSLIGEAKEITKTAGHVQLRYERNDKTYVRIMSWIRDEQRCCSFLTFQVEVQPAGGDLLLRLGDGEEIVAYLSATMFGGSMVAAASAR